MSLLTVLFAILLAGCARLQPGYYLTPENYPVQPAAAEQVQIMPSAPPPTSTPISTIQTVDIGGAAETSTAVPAELPIPTAGTAPPACEETSGRMVFGSYPSTLAGGEFRYRVHLPPCYEQTGKRYPYLIIMHGLVPGTDLMNDAQWDQMGLDEAADAGFRDGTLPPMIIVMPNGNDVNHGNDDSPFARLLVTELMPEIESKFCTWNTSATRAIGGLSRGGFWAFSVAFLYPDLFDRVGGHSPFLYDGDYPVYNPYNLADDAQGIERLTMYIDHGAQDYVDVGVQGFIEKLNARGIEPIYVVNETGGHTEDYWAAHTEDYLQFYAAEWPRDLSVYPDCQEPGR
ncbi:MAG: hypothetical protein Kow00124_00870 [Anaerolineae bacterium]